MPESIPDVRPRHPTQHTTDSGLVNADVGGYLSMQTTLSSFLANAADEFLGQLGGKVRRPGLVQAGVATLPPFGVHVADVLQVRPYPEVVWPNAGRIVAAVANASARWYRANGHLIGDAVGLLLTPGRIDPHYPVAPIVTRSLPLPTVVRATY